MKKIVKSLLCISLAATMPIGGLAGCFGGGGGGTTDGDAAELVFYRARSNDMADGTYDADVTKALEDKFFADTGNKIKLTMRMYSGDDLPTQVDTNFTRKKSIMEGVMHYISEDGGSAILKYAKEPDATLDVEPLLNEHGKNILAAIRKNDTDHLSERAGYVAVNDGYKMNIIPSYAQERSYAVLIRKDMMQDVYATTGIDPEKYDVLNDDYQNMKLSDFEKVLKAIKKEVEGIQYSITGAPWDIGRVIAPVYGVDYTSSGLDEYGNYVPSHLTPGFEEYVDLMYRWASEGIWEKDSVNMGDDKRLNWFVAGQAACFIAYPEITNLISVARKFNAANNDPNAELMVLAPFADEEGKVNGYLKTNRSFEGMILPYKAVNAELTVKFLDWMYADVENYELAKHGVKGVHWVEGEDVTVGGTTYKTWQYPDDKTDEYKTKPPYSGMWELLPNINVSNRIDASYNTNEKAWYIHATQNFEMFGNAATEAIWMADLPTSLSYQAEVIAEYEANIRGKAWAGITDANGNTPKQMMVGYKEKVYRECNDYFTYVNGKYTSAVDFFKTKFGA